jgi:formylglycine-generating enzyme required for sulfatase activity
LGRVFQKIEKSILMKILVCTFLSVMSVLLVLTSTSAAEEYVNSINMEFIRVPAGTFLMGAHDLENGSSKETPRHTVHISQAFYLAKYEVTQEQWMAVMGSINPSNFISQDRPVDEVSWNDVQIFIQRLNTIEKTHAYRLPTEAEWEYAARAGSETSYCYGDDPEGAELARYAWFEQNAGQQTHPVGRLSPNAWGFYDMHGNVTEWVQDFYDKQYYSVSPEKDPRGPKTGRKMVVRGGSWINQPYSCRSAARGYYSADYTDSDFGFRIVKVVE